MGLEPTSGMSAAACFPSRFLTNSDDFHNHHRHQGGSRPTLRGGADSNSQAIISRHLFSRQGPHPAGWLPFFDCGGWNRTNMKTFKASHPAVRCIRIGTVLARGEWVEPPSPGSEPGSLPLADPRSCSRAPCGESNPPRRIGSPEPLPLGQRHKAEGGGVEPSRR